MKVSNAALLAGALAVTLAMISRAPASAASDVTFTNGAVDVVYGVGSATLFPLMNDLAVAYMESDGCLMQPVDSEDFPPPAGSADQPTCQSGAGTALAGDNVYENYDHDAVVNYFPQGDDAGRAQLCTQKTSADGSGPTRASQIPYVDFARTSSAPSNGMQCRVTQIEDVPWVMGETGTVLRFVAFARDAVSYTHWNTATGGGSNVNSLTQGQLNDIFVDCTITDWGQVGGTPGKPIIVHSTSLGSGVRTFFDAFILGNSTNCISPQFKDGDVTNGERVVRENQMMRIERALNDPGAADEGNSISFMSTGVHAVSPDAGHSLIGRINGVAPTETTIVNGSFPLSRDVYLVYRLSGPNSPIASAAVRRFLGFPNPTATNGQAIGWICKAEENHSEPVGTPGLGIETATATRDWFDTKQAIFAANGMYQLPADPTFGDRCNAVNVSVA